MASRAEGLIRQYVAAYIVNNAPARLLSQHLDALGVGFMPLIDHITIRTHDVETRAREFLDLGFTFDEVVGVLEFDDWWARVYRKPGLPAVFIDQAFVGARGATSVIPRWVEQYGDQMLHHVAVLVDDIDKGIAALTELGIEFGGPVVGDPGSSLRQIFSRPEMRDGEPFTVLELAERHDGYTGFLPPQADGLMESTRR